jgi:O-antigen/teichoic acid export membrane protein
MAALAPLVGPLYGHQFRGSIVPLLILLPGVAALAVGGTAAIVLSIFNRPEVSSIAELAGIVLTGAGLWLVLDRYGIIGAAIVSSVSYCCTGLTQILWLRRLGVRNVLPKRDDAKWAVARLIDIAHRGRRIG